ESAETGEVSQGELALKKDSKSYIITGGDSKLEIDRKTGEISNWSYYNHKMTEEPIKINFWRAPTDNDLGNKMQEWAKIWKTATYNYTAKLINIPKKEDNTISYQVEYKLPDDIARVYVDYTIDKKGAIHIDYIFKPLEEDLPNIPRIGMYMIVSDEFTDVSWFGRGPDESYWDRKNGRKSGIYSGKIQNQFHRYPRPQETGNKTEVRWLEIESPEVSLKVIGKSS